MSEEVDLLSGDVVAELLEGLAWCAEKRLAIGRRSGSKGKHRADRRWLVALSAAVRQYVRLVERMPDGAWEVPAQRKACRSLVVAWRAASDVGVSEAGEARAKAEAMVRRHEAQALAEAFGFDAEEGRAWDGEWAEWFVERADVLAAAQERLSVMRLELGRRSAKDVLVGPTRFAVERESVAWWGDGSGKGGGYVERFNLNGLSGPEEGDDPDPSE